MDSLEYWESVLKVREHWYEINVNVLALLNDLEITYGFRVGRNPIHSYFFSKNDIKDQCTEVTHLNSVSPCGLSVWCCLGLPCLRQRNTYASEQQVVKTKKINILRNICWVTQLQDWRWPAPWYSWEWSIVITRNILSLPRGGYVRRRWIFVILARLLS